jgi:hypothetical protein
MGCGNSKSSKESDNNATVVKEDKKEASSSSGGKSKREYIKTIIVHRHGARGPTKGNKKALQSEENSKPNSPITQWRDDEWEKLTEVGQAQLQALGKWFGEVYFAQWHPEINLKENPGFKWKSSKIDRSLHSGQNLWKGLHDSKSYATPAEPEPWPEGSDPDTWMRPWRFFKEYKENMKAIEKTEEFIKKAKEEEAILRTMHKKAGLDSTKDPVELLACIHYFKEMLDVELYYPDKTKNVFSSRFTKEEITKIEDLARWNWSKHFFSPVVRPMSNMLLKEIARDLKDEKLKFIVYSAHDYNVISLLAGLGQEIYPDGNCVGYATFLLFELYREDGKLFVEVTLNDPFEDKKFQPTKDVQWNAIKDWKWECYKGGHIALEDFAKKFE